MALPMTTALAGLCGVLETTCGDGDSSVEVFIPCEHGCAEGGLPDVKASDGP